MANKFAPRIAQLEFRMTLTQSTSDYRELLASKIEALAARRREAGYFREATPIEKKKVMEYFRDVYGIHQESCRYLRSKRL